MYIQLNLINYFQSKIYITFIISFLLDVFNAFSIDYDQLNYYNTHLKYECSIFLVIFSSNFTLLWLWVCIWKNMFSTYFEFVTENFIPSDIYAKQWIFNWDLFFCGKIVTTIFCSSSLWVCLCCLLFLRTWSWLKYLSFILFPSTMLKLLVPKRASSYCHLSFWHLSGLSWGCECAYWKIVSE